MVPLLSSTDELRTGPALECLLQLSRNWKLISEDSQDPRAVRPRCLEPSPAWNTEEIDCNQVCFKASNADIFEFSKCRTGGQAQEKVRTNLGKTEVFSLTKGRRSVSHGLTFTGWEPCRREPFISEGWCGLGAGMCYSPKELCCYLFKYIVNKQINTK